MKIVKHKLTTETDKITGAANKDLFLAPLSGPGHLPTLTSTDRLDGGGGLDSIRANLDDVPTAPIMKSIERGAFTFAEASNISLDLAKAKQMRDVTLKSDAGNSGAHVEIDNAAGVSSLRIQDDDGQNYVVDGLDAERHKSFKLLVDGAGSSNIELVSINSETFASLAITLKNGADTELRGNCVNAPKLTINSTASSGQVGNHLDIDPGMHTGIVKHLKVMGDQNLTLYTSSDTFRHLDSFDSTGMSAIVWSSFGGEELDSVKGGSGTEIIDISEIGGSTSSKAKVTLGGGHDYLTLKFALDSATQQYDGGKGTDTITLEGAAANLNDAATNFENVHVNHASGLYDVAGMKLVNFLLFSTSTAATIDGLADGATLGIYQDVTTFMTVNVADAGLSATESMRLLLQNSADLGTAVAGFMAPELSNLEIDCYSSDHTMYLGSVGSASNGATIEITGDTRLTLRASNASTSYIDTLTIASDAGADISGLADGTQAFVSTGATIAGGSGDDVLVGGQGADAISTGGGDNTVIGSLGADEVTLLNGGLDVLVFTSQAQSSFGLQGDTIANFGAFDIIDISAIVSDATFAGNFSDHTTGLAALSSSHASAYFNTVSHTLYIDLNHDKAMGGPTDMEIELAGVAIFDDSQLLS